MTADDLESGTARIASVADRFDTDVVVNLQGDAPLTDPAVVAAAARSAEDTGAPVTMAVYPLSRAADVADPNTVKVIRGQRRPGALLLPRAHPVRPRRAGHRNA